MPGNFLGARGRYQYTDDGGQNFTIETDVDLATAAGLAPATDDPRTPTRFKPRIVYVQAASGQRKRLICGTSDSTLYAANAPQTVTIDAVQFQTTGRRGEKVSF